jgi:hypothetical protein
MSLRDAVWSKKSPSVWPKFAPGAAWEIRSIPGAIQKNENVENQWPSFPGAS